MKRLRDLLFGDRRRPVAVPARFRVTASAKVIRADGSVERLAPLDMGLIDEDQAKALAGEKWQRS